MEQFRGKLRQKDKNGPYYYRLTVANGLRKEFALKTCDYCNAPRFSRAALRRSSQKMKISFFESHLHRPLLFYAAEALNHLSYS